VIDAFSRTVFGADERRAVETGAGSVVSDVSTATGPVSETIMAAGASDVPRHEHEDRDCPFVVFVVFV
jgi:hypothetical protein